MTSPLTLQLVLDFGLPAGTNPADMERIHSVAWKPLVAQLLDAESIRFGVHLSGSVLDWVSRSDMDWVGDIREMIGRGQSEIIGGPRHGAVIHSVPSRDILGQILLHSRDLKQVLGEAPSGLLLPQGAWDPIVPRALARTELAYAFVGRRLLQPTTQTVDGWYVADREGQSLALFPVDESLQVFFPWASPKQLFAKLAQLWKGGRTLVTVVIPATQFGAVHGAEHRCWGQRWVLALLKGLRSQNAWVKTALPFEILEKQRSSGRAAPTAGVSMDVALGGLSAQRGHAFSTLQQTVLEKKDPVLMDASPWLVGPAWESVLVRHDAANRLHKYALRVSNQLARLQKRVDRGLIDRDQWDDLHELLYRGQCGAVLNPRAALRDAALRHSCWHALSEADVRSRQLLGRLDKLQFKVMDAQAEGDESVEVVNGTFRTLVRPSAGGALSELVYWGVGNVMNTFSRQRETWFDALERNTTLPVLVDDSADGPSIQIDDADASPTSAQGKSSGLWPHPPDLPPLEGASLAMLGADRHRRLWFADHILGPQTDLANLAKGQPQENGQFLDEPYEFVRAEREEDDVVVSLARDGAISAGGSQRLIRIEKRYRFVSGSPSFSLNYQISNRYQEPLQSLFGVELNINLDGEDTNRRYMVMGGDRRRVGMQRMGSREDVDALSVVFEDVRFRIQIGLSHPATVHFFPVYSPVRNANQYEKGFQGTCVFLVWPLALWGTERMNVSLTVTSDSL